MSRIAVVLTLETPLTDSQGIPQFMSIMKVKTCPTTLTSDGGANTLNARGLHAHRREKRLEQSAAFGDIKRNLVNEVVDIK